MCIHVCASAVALCRREAPEEEGVERLVCLSEEEEREDGVIRGSQTVAHG